jgi:hypothetical protein
MRDLLVRIKEENISGFEPLFEPGNGFTYSNLKGHSFEEQVDLLRGLEKEGFLSAELFDSVLQCKACHSIELTMKLSCTVCKSTNLVRGGVIEHLTCGNIDFDEKFRRQVSNVLECNKCGKRLKAIGVDYSKPGTFYKCLNCKAMLPEMDSNYMCFCCGAGWTEGQLQSLQLMTYNVNAEKIAEYFVGTIFLPAVVAGLNKKYGIIAMSPGKIVGLSKVQHTFDLLVSPYGSVEPILIGDILENKGSISSHRDNVQILAFYTKGLDVNFSTRKVIKKILVPQATELREDTRQLAAAYGIIILQSTNSEDVVAKVIEILDRP